MIDRTIEKLKTAEAGVFFCCAKGGEREILTKILRRTGESDLISFGNEAETLGNLGRDQIAKNKCVPIASQQLREEMGSILN